MTSIGRQVPASHLRQCMAAAAPIHCSGQAGSETFGRSQAGVGTGDAGSVENVGTCNDALVADATDVSAMPGRQGGVLPAQHVSHHTSPHCGLQIVGYAGRLIVGPGPGRGYLPASSAATSCGYIMPANGRLLQLPGNTRAGNGVCPSDMIAGQHAALLDSSQAAWVPC